MKLNRMFVKNYMSIRSMIIPDFQSITLFCGENGSGKSTIADLLGIILFNQDVLGLTSDNKREIRTGVRWEVEGVPQRTGRIISYLIIELLDDDGLYILQGVRIISSGNDTPARTFFSVIGKPLEMIGARGNNQMAQDEDICYSDPDITKYTTHTAAFRDFFAQRKYNVEFINDEYAMKMYKQYMINLLTNQSLQGARGNKFQSFIKTSILPKPTAVTIAGERRELIDQYKEAKRDFDDYEEERSFYERYCKYYTDYAKKKEKADILERLTPYIIDEGADTLISTSQTNIAAAEKKLELIGNEIIRIQAEIRELRAKRDKLIASNQEEQQLKEKLDSIEKEKLRLEKCQEEYERYASMADSLLELIGEQRIDPDGAIDTVSNLYRVFQNRKAEETSEARQRKQELEEDLNEKTDRLHELQGGRPARGDVASAIRIRDLINEKFQKEGVGEEVHILYECIAGVKDEKWQPAIEVLLGRNLFGIVVSPENYRLACAIQHDFRTERRDSSTLILKTRRRSVKPVQRSVYSALEITDSHADDYLYSTCGDCLMAETNEEYVSTKNALRINGQHQNGNGSYYREQDLSQMRLFIGEEVREREREKLRVEIAETEAAIQTVKDKMASAERLCKHADSIYMQMTGCRIRETDAFADLALVEEDYQRTLQEYEQILKGEAHRIFEERKKEIEQRSEELSEKLRKQQNDRTETETRKQGDINNLNFAKSRKAENKKTMEGLPELNILPESDISEVLLWAGRFNPNIDSLLESEMESLKKIAGESCEVVRDVWETMPVHVKERTSLFLVMDNPESQDNYRYIDEQLKKMDVRMDQQKREKMQALIESLEKQFTGLLDTMGEDEANARRMRNQYNRFIQKYPIGGITYWIGDMNDIMSEDADIIRAARDIFNGEMSDLVQAVIEKLKKKAETVQGADFDRIFDYTSYITCPLMYRGNDPAARARNLDNNSSMGSNGQQLTLRYFLYIGTMACQVYSDDSLRIILCDEATKGMDDENARSFVGMLRDADVQTIMFNYSQALNPYVDRLYVVSTPKSGPYRHQMKIVPGVRKSGKEGVEDDRLQKAN